MSAAEIPESIPEHVIDLGWAKLTAVACSNDPDFEECTNCFFSGVKDCQKITNCGSAFGGVRWEVQK